MDGENAEQELLDETFHVARSQEGDPQAIAPEPSLTGPTQVPPPQVSQPLPQDHGPTGNAGLGGQDPLYYVAESLHSLRQYNEMMLGITQDQNRLHELQRRLDEEECKFKHLKRCRNDWLTEESGRIDRCEEKT